MKTVQDIINHTRKYFLGNDSIKFTDEDGLEIFNDAYVELAEQVRKSHQNYYWECWTQDYIAGINEYILNEDNLTGGLYEPDLVLAGIRSIERVFINFDGDETFIPLPKIPYLDHKAELKKTLNGGYYVLDNSIFIFPPTKYKGMDGTIKMYGTRGVVKLEADSNRIDLPDDYKRLLPFLMAYYFYQAGREIDKAQVAEQKYITELKDTHRAITVRTENPVRYGKVYYINRN